MIVGMTIASMIPRELSRICHSAAAMGPFGSRTPSEQPPSVAAPIRTTASRGNRMLNLLCLERLGRSQSDPRVRRYGPSSFDVVGKEARKNQEQVKNREHEQTRSIAATGKASSAQPECEHNEDRPVDDGGRRVDCAGKA